MKIHHSLLYTRRFVVLSGWFFLTGSMLSWPSVVGAQPGKIVSDSIHAIMARYPVVGISVAVVKNNKLIYAESFGYKNLETKTPLTNESVFRIASISKSFTSTSLMQLVQKKKIRLDDDVSNLLGFKVRNPNFPDKVITLKMLLSHTSSLNDSQGYFSLNTIDPSENSDWAKCYNNYEPGTQYQYCNFNYTLAGTIVERISGERFDHYVANHILKPLNIYGGYNVNELDSTRFAQIYSWNTDSSKFIHSPEAYAPRKTEIANYVMGRSTPVFSPAGGMKISATGLARYMMMHLDMGKTDGVRIISAKSERMMRKPVSEKEHYGLGLLTTQNLIPEQTLTGHTGGAYGLISFMFFQPKEKYGIVLISNGCIPQYLHGYEAALRDATNALYKILIRDN